MKINLITPLFLVSLTMVLSCNDHLEQPVTTLSLQAYTDTLNRIIAPDTSRINAFATTRESILDQAEGYRKEYETLRSLSVPAEVSSVHADFVSAIREQYESNLSAGNNTPASLPATQENINEYLHYRADVGYARDDEAQAGCKLKSILSQYNLTLNAAGVCEAAGSPKVPDQAAGTTSNPVSEVYMLHDVIKEADGSTIRPNVDGFVINSIVARAQTPLTITFDNKNTRPFVFSFSIYKGAATRLQNSDFVAGTAAYSGVKVHKLTVTLAPGTYSYVDNVHPIAMRGKLIVVE